MKFDLLDASGSTLDSVAVHLNSFPMINVATGTSTPPSGSPGFFNFCGPKQSPFYVFIPRGFTAYGGTVLVLPKPGTQLRTYGNFLLPNDVIAHTASLRVRIVQN